MQTATAAVDSQLCSASRLLCLLGAVTEPDRHRLMPAVGLSGARRQDHGPVATGHVVAGSRLVIGVGISVCGNSGGRS